MEYKRCVGEEESDQNATTVECAGVTHLVQGWPQQGHPNEVCCKILLFLLVLMVIVATLYLARYHAHELWCSQGHFLL